MTTSSSGIVEAAPRLWLRAEGVVLLAASLTLFARTHQPWWLVPLVILLPDLSMVGYLGSTRVGAWTYNVGHAAVVPVVVAVVGVLQESPLTTALGLLWLAHVGMDRAAGYGLKYDDRFTHTHLGLIGPDRTTP